MRDATDQRSSTMILIGAVRQPSEPHVSHAVSGPSIKSANPRCGMVNHQLFQEGQRCALLTTKSRNTCTRATVFNSSG